MKKYLQLEEKITFCRVDKKGSGPHGPHGPQESRGPHGSHGLHKHQGPQGPPEPFNLKNYLNWN